MEISVGLGHGLVAQEFHSGRVKIEGIDTLVSSIHPSELFWRQFALADFDVSELSLASLMISRTKGDRTWVALPIFPERRFFHTDILVRRGLGIVNPRELEGRRIGVPEYQQTASVWTRGILRDEYGVNTQKIAWFMEHTKDLSHGGAVGSEIPVNTELHYIRQDENMADMLRRGHLDGILRYVPTPNLLDRSSGDLLASGHAELLFSNPDEENRRYFLKTGLRPMNHCVVVRRTLVKKYPWLMMSVWSAFQRAKNNVIDKTRLVIDSMYAASALGFDTSFLDVDPLPFGVQVQSRDLETVSRYLFEDGLLASKVDLSDVFEAYMSPNHC